MEWNVKNALSRDVEREHLNKILADIRATVNAVEAEASQPTDDVRGIVGSMVEGNTEEGLSVTYNPTAGVLDFAVNNFIITLAGDITGSGTVSALRNVTITTTIDPSKVGIPDAPFDNHAYWRLNGEWSQVADSILSLSDLRGEGFIAQSYDDVEGEVLWEVRVFEAAPGELTITNPTGLNGNPLYGLADLPDSGVGTSPVQLFTRDAKGRVEGTEDADTDDLPEGLDNLYFTEERAQDAVGAILVDTADIDLTYDDVTPSISGVLTAAIHDSLNLADSALQSGDNVSELVNDAGYLTTAVLSIVPGTNITVDATDPENPIISTTGGGAGGTVTSVGTGTGLTGGPITSTGTISLNSASIASLALADSAVQPAALDAKVDVAGDVMTGPLGMGMPVGDYVLAINSSLGTGVAGIPALIVQGDTNNERIQLRSSVSSATSYEGKVSGGTAASPTATPIGYRIAQLAGGGHDGTDWVLGNKAFVRMYTSEAWTPTANGTAIEILTTPNGTISPAVVARFDNTDITHSVNTTIAVGANNGAMRVSADTGWIADFALQKNKVDRWILRSTNSPEVGSNTGSDFTLRARADDGSNLHNVFDVTRSTGVLNFGVAPTILGNVVWNASNLPVDVNTSLGTVPIRTASGDIICRLIRSDYTTATTVPAYFVGQSALGAGADNYHRPITPANAWTALMGAVDTGWTNITPINGYTNSGGGFANLSWRKVGNLVMLRGALSGAGTIGTSMGTLPAGARPPTTMQFGVDFPGTNGALAITTAGSLIPANSQPGTFYFDGVAFYID